MTNIYLLKDGPIIVTADEIIVTQDGNEHQAGSKIALCRCGQSGNKPYCDGAHKQEEKGLPEGEIQTILYK